MNRRGNVKRRTLVEPLIIVCDDDSNENIKYLIASVRDFSAISRGLAKRKGHSNKYTYLVQLARHTSAVVSPAVFPNKPDVSCNIVQAAVAPLLKEALNRSQVHGLPDDDRVVFDPDDDRVVFESQATPVDRFTECLGDRGSDQGVDDLRQTKGNEARRVKC